MDGDQQYLETLVRRDNLQQEKQRLEQHITDSDGAILFREKKAEQVDAEGCFSEKTDTLKANGLEYSWYPRKVDLSC